VVEVSLRLLGITPLRVRLSAATGELAVADAADSPFAALRLELSATPTRSSVPLANRLLRRAIPGGHRLVITLPAIELSGGSALMHADGTVYAKPLAQPADPAPEGTRPDPRHSSADQPDSEGPDALDPAQVDVAAVRWPVCFLVRSIESAELRGSDVILLDMRGRLRRPRKPSRTSPVLSFLRPWIRVETAAEFTR
jgi:hypothetical protein